MTRRLNSGSTGLDAAHDEVSLNLPWYVNGTLSGLERAAVEQHLRVCLPCRRESIALGALHEAVTARTCEPQCEAALGRLHQRLDEEQAEASYFPWAAAAVLVIVAGLAGFVGVNSGLIRGNESGSAYSTLGARTVKMVDTPVVTARIVFDHDITELQLRNLLLAADAELVDGPTKLGAYTIVLTKATPGDDLQAAVRTLRESKQVLFVEPIVAIGSQRSAD